MKTENKVLRVLLLVVSLIVIFQRWGDWGGPDVPAPEIDTLTVYKEVHDTVKGKTKFVKGETDTLWSTVTEYVPDTSYPKLLGQYKKLGNEYFEQRVFETEFALGEYGSAKITDSISTNTLISSKIAYNLNIPEKTITIREHLPPTRQLYVGTSIFGNPKSYITGVSVGALYKDKKDKIFGASVGYDGQIVYGVSSYWKIK